MDKQNLRENCIDLLRIIVSKEYGVNRQYAEKLPDFEDMIHLDAEIGWDEKGKTVYRSFAPNEDRNDSRIAYRDTVDIAFSPGIYFGEEGASCFQPEPNIWCKPLMIDDESESYGECGIYEELFIVFKKNTEEYDWQDLFYVSSKDELLGLMGFVKNLWDVYAGRDIVYSQYVCELEEYAGEFLYDLKCDFPVFEHIQWNLPLKFHRFNYEQPSYCVLGDIDAREMDTTINIFNCNVSFELTELKRTLRHEILHYCLYNSKLPF